LVEVGKETECKTVRHQWRFESSLPWSLMQKSRRWTMFSGPVNS